ncbi:MAG: nucleoside triphosphate pyrophosphohydrolase, partial [Chloroflexota bacterium]
MSYTTDLYALLELDAETSLQIVPARTLLDAAQRELSGGHLIQAGSAVLVTGGTEPAEPALLRTLRALYPPGHGIRRTSAGLFAPPLPPLEHGSYLAAVQYVTERLRASDGCPWDREQNHQSIKGNLLEEAYEVVDALDAGDPAKLSEELGDLLFQVTLHAEIARQQGEFDLRDVALGITSKLVRRHPHVFADGSASTAAEVLQNWDEIKKKERGGSASLLAGVAVAMPALAYAQEVAKRAARQGFHQARTDPALAALREELAEL